MEPKDFSAGYNTWLLQNSIRPETYAGYSDAEKQALLENYNTLTPVNDKNSWTSMSGLGGLALGGAQLGVGILGTLDAMKTAKEQRKLLGQQYDTNVEKMAAWREGRDNVKSAFGGGLAARGVV